MIHFITDSTANLNKELIGNHPIDVISLSVLVDDEVFIETKTQNDIFYKKMRQAKNFPKSAQPNVETVIETFESKVSKGDAVIAVLISSEMSGTYQTALMVKHQLLEAYPEAQIEVIDSRTNCMQMGYCVLHGAELAAEGRPFEEIVSAMRNHVNRSRFIFLPETLEYLKMGGRIGGASAMIGSLLQILPILTVKEGKTEVLQKVRTKRKAVDAMVEFVMTEINERGVGNVAVHHIEALAEGQELARRLEEALDISVPVVDIGPVIGTHVGPGAIGIAYDLKA